MRSVIKMTAHTLVNPHNRTKGTAITTVMINLGVMTTEGTRRLRNPLRTAKVAIMLTMSKRVRPHLVTILVPVARNRPSGKSRKFVSNPPHATDLEAVPQTDQKRIITFSLEILPRRMKRITSNGEESPPPKVTLSLSLKTETTMVGAERIPQRRSNHLPEGRHKILVP